MPTSNDHTHSEMIGLREAQSDTFGLVGSTPGSIGVFGLPKAQIGISGLLDNTTMGGGLVPMPASIVVIGLPEARPAPNLQAAPLHERPANGVTADNGE
ncbi:hypothetical protein [Chloroflexus sp.]|uniref:hypothetical protein n=1 Tax=Chloroflexus sp. TaxID=1904827 RepID=UPI002ACD6A89|nr:hypothetical protein [Chloroflexus sp.]